jgi:5,6-dimethylbenzimidazole synthase
VADDGLTRKSHKLEVGHTRGRSPGGLNDVDLLLAVVSAGRECRADQSDDGSPVTRLGRSQPEWGRPVCAQPSDLRVALGTGHLTAPFGPRAQRIGPVRLRLSVPESSGYSAAVTDGARNEPAAPLPGTLSDLYRAIHGRRDVRGEFNGEPVPAEVLTRVLGAAHAAPSVGLSQPWDFVVVDDRATRAAFAAHVAAEREVFAASLPEELAERFADIKIEGIAESSLSLVVTYDAARGAPFVLGRHAIADAGLYSVCLAIENLWLAATAEGMGVGWVSFYRESFLRELLLIPEEVRPVAWLCVGPVTRLHAVPDLERHGWRRRLALEDVVHYNAWGVRTSERPLRPVSGGEP